MARCTYSPTGWRSAGIGSGWSDCVTGSMRPAVSPRNKGWGGVMSSLLDQTGGPAPADTEASALFNPARSQTLTFQLLYPATAAWRSHHGVLGFLSAFARRHSLLGPCDITSHACPQLHRPATTRRRRGSLTSIRNTTPHSANKITDSPPEKRVSQPHEYPKSFRLSGGGTGRRRPRVRLRCPARRCVPRRQGGARVR